MAIDKTNLKTQVQAKIDGLTGTETVKELLTLAKAAEGLNVDRAALDAAIENALDGFDVNTQLKDLLTGGKATGSAADPTLVGGTLMLDKNFPDDYSVDGKRYLKSGSIETNASKFDTDVFKGKNILGADSVIVPSVYSNTAHGFLYVSLNGYTHRTPDLINYELVSIDDEYGVVGTFGNKGLAEFGSGVVALTNNWLHYSEDGVNFVKKISISSLGGSSSYGLAVSNGALYILIRVGSLEHIYKSTDLESFVRVGRTFQWSRQFRHNEENGKLYVLERYNVYECDPAIDDTSWTALSAVGSNPRGFDVFNNIMVYFNEDDYLYISEDYGATFGLIGRNHPYLVAYENGILFYKQGTRIYYSLDNGENFSTIDANPVRIKPTVFNGEILFNIYYADDSISGLGRLDTSTYTMDSSVFNKTNLPEEAYTEIKNFHNGIYYSPTYKGGTLFMWGGTKTTSLSGEHWRIYETQDGVNWSLFNEGTTGYIFGMAHDGGDNIVIAQNKSYNNDNNLRIIHYSIIGGTFTDVSFSYTSSNTGAMGGVLYDEEYGRFVITGYRDTIYSPTGKDGTWASTLNLNNTTAFSREGWLTSVGDYYITGVLWDTSVPQDGHQLILIEKGDIPSTYTSTQFICFMGGRYYEFKYSGADESNIYEAYSGTPDSRTNIEYKSAPFENITHAQSSKKEDRIWVFTDSGEVWTTDDGDNWVLVRKNLRVDCNPKRIQETEDGSLWVFDKAYGGLFKLTSEPYAGSYAPYKEGDAFQFMRIS